MKLFRNILLIILLCLAQYAKATEIATTQSLSGKAYASLLTCGPGDEFYETFGHSALRIYDSVNGIDIVFNYGTFNFAEPHFYLKFAKGKLDYNVNKQPFDIFISEYMFYGRAVWEQRLTLDSVELSRLYSSLMINALPENKYYKYDFFRDNCATRVHHMIQESLNDTQKLAFDTPRQRASYRDLIYKYTDKDNLWWRFGVDILLGARCDKPMTTEEYMYVPMEMMTQYDTTFNRSGSHLSAPAEKLLDDSRETSSTVFSPSLCFMLLFLVVLILTIMAKRRGWRLLWLDGILFSAAGLVSLLLLFLWFGSDHWCTKWNFNLLWANPLFPIMLFRLRKGNRILSIILTCCFAALILIWIAGWPQILNSAAMLITLTLLVRVGTRERRTENGERGTGH